MAHMWSTISTSVPPPQRRLWHICWKQFLLILMYTYSSPLQTRVKLLNNVTQLLTFPIIVIYGAATTLLLHSICPAHYTVCGLCILPILKDL